MKLKTLNDFRGFCVVRYCEDCEEHEVEFIQKSPEAKVMGTYAKCVDLKQEAIKHIMSIAKEMAIMIKKEDDGEDITEEEFDEVKMLTGQANWIKHFFNITEGELKDA